MTGTLFSHLCLLLAVSTIALGRDTEPQADAPPIEHVQQNIEGWIVHVDKRLVGPEEELGREALKILACKLHGIKLVMAKKPLEQLQQVPIWVDLDHKLRTMQYHPSKAG